LEVQIDRVPNFVEAPPIPDCPFPAWWLALQSWLAEKGFFFLEMQLPPGMPWMPVPLPALCIFFGETTTGIKHAIVGRVEEDRMLPVWNPWPEAEFSGGVGALGFLIPRDPHDVIRMGIALERIRKLATAEGLVHHVAAKAIVDEINKGLATPDVSLILSGLNGAPK
jgi:hypothetical protein